MVELWNLPRTVIRLRMLCYRFLEENPKSVAAERIRGTLFDLESAQIKKEDFDFISLWALGRATKILPNPTTE